jgi:excisionase family DNA binding protein
MSADKEYLRATDIAQLTGMSVRTVRRWIAAEILPSTKLGGSRLVARADLAHVLAPYRASSELADPSEEDNGDSSK